VPIPLLLVSSSRFADHVTPPGHPERVERADVFDGIALHWRERGGLVVGPRAATVADLCRVHDPAYVDKVAATQGRAVRLEPDTYTSPESYDVATLAAGAVLSAVDYAIETGAPALALVRPPGHHAERDKAMGFCLFNNVAVGAAYARSRGHARVGIVDFDVHHGNGTQWIFYDDPSVLYVSTHQYPYYPGTGSAIEIGTGAGAGFTLNVPLEAGATDADYDLAFAELIVPTLEAFRPDLLLVSAGYDAHHRDPLASMRVSTDGFAAMVLRLWQLASRACGGRLVAVAEGGYDLFALAGGLEATIEVLSAPPSAPEPMQGDHARARESIEMTRGILAPYWPNI
jgi:acetoin utilization deacetylase AcuC-like enzyme